MAYYQAHLLLLAGYSQFFVSGLVLPQPAFDVEDDEMTAEEEEEMEGFMDEDESPEGEPIVVDEPCPQFASTEEDEDEDDFDVEPLTPVTLVSPVPEQRRRKRLSAVSESHVRTMSRWLLDSAISLGDRQQQQQQSSDPESLQSPREDHETKRFCVAGRRPRLPAIQTSFTFMPPRLSVS